MMDDVRFYVIFNVISFISRRWKVDNERLCAMEFRFTVEKISPPAGIELGPLDQ